MKTRKSPKKATQSSQSMVDLNLKLFLFFFFFFLCKFYFESCNFDLIFMFFFPSFYCSLSVATVEICSDAAWIAAWRLHSISVCFCCFTNLQWIWMFDVLYSDGNWFSWVFFVGRGGTVNCIKKVPVCLFNWYWICRISKQCFCFKGSESEFFFFWGGGGRLWTVLRRSLFVCLIGI